MNGLLKKIIIILCTLIVIINGFIITHINPSISIRTHLFISGHPIGAFRVNVQTNELQYKIDKNILDNENAMIYSTLGYKLYDRATGKVLSNYKVKKIEFLYFTDEYGEG